jgi:hypothetical protein
VAIGQAHRHDRHLHDDQVSTDCRWCLGPGVRGGRDHGHAKHHRCRRPDLPVVARSLRHQNLICGTSVPPSNLGGVASPHTRKPAPPPHRATPRHTFRLRSSA